MTLLLFRHRFSLHTVLSTFNFVSNQQMSVESLEPIQLQNSWNPLAHGEITECSGQFPPRVEGHGLKCCKSPEWWVSVSSWHSWWRCLEWIRSLVRSTRLRPLQMARAAISRSLDLELVFTSSLQASAWYHPIIIRLVFRESSNY